MNSQRGVPHGSEPSSGQGRSSGFFRPFLNWRRMVASFGSEAVSDGEGRRRRKRRRKRDMVAAAAAREWEGSCERVKC